MWTIGSSICGRASHLHMDMVRGRKCFLSNTVFDNIIWHISKRLKVYLHKTRNSVHPTELDSQKMHHISQIQVHITEPNQNDNKLTTKCLQICGCNCSNKISGRTHPAEKLRKRNSQFFSPLVMKPHLQQELHLYLTTKHHPFLRTICKETYKG